MKLKFAVMLPVIAALWLAACSSDSNTNTARKIELELGSEVFLNGGKTVTFVAWDKEALEELLKAHMANDDTGFEEVQLSGRVSYVPNGTKVLVIDYGRYRAWRVRILEGEYKNRAVWVSESWIATSRPAPAR